MRRRRGIKFLRCASPYILMATLAGGMIVYSTSGWVKNAINDRRIEQELENVDDSSSYEIPVFESEYPEQIDTTESVEEEEKIEEEIEETTEEALEEIPESRPISDELLTSGYEFRYEKFDELEEKIEQNSDVNAWITIDGTKIDYPVAYAPDKDRDYYSHHDLDGNDSNSGTLYLLNDNKSLNNLEDDISDVSLIFGHHMRGGKMFAQVCNYVNQSFYDEHPFGVIYTPDGYAYKVTFFAGIVTPGENNTDVYVSRFTDEEMFNAYIENARSKSTFQSDVEVNYGDKIMVLFTCEYTGGPNSRYALFGVIEKQYTNELQYGNNDEISRRLK